MIAAAENAFDRLAGTYDSAWTRSAIGMSQRLAVWRRIDPLFGPGDRILDLGCGTGADAIHLQSREIETYAVDVSAEMVKVARNRGVNAHRLPIEQIAELNGTFDGAISNFGALNCIERLEGVPLALSRLIRSGRYIAICLMGPCCVWETLYFLLHRNFHKAFRRFGSGKAISSIGLEVGYPSTRRLKKIFGRNFELIRWYGIGLCVPPSYVRALSNETVHWLAQADTSIAHWPVFRALADHRLFIFKRL